jgi:hypothetical protein
VTFPQRAADGFDGHELWAKFGQDLIETFEPVEIAIHALIAERTLVDAVVYRHRWEWPGFQLVFLSPQVGAIWAGIQIAADDSLYRLPKDNLTPLRVRTGCSAWTDRTISPPLLRAPAVSRRFWCHSSGNQEEGWTLVVPNVGKPLPIQEVSRVLNNAYDWLSGLRLAGQVWAGPQGAPQPVGEPPFPT